MNWMGTIIGGALLAAVTSGAFLASSRGWGLAGRLDQPVSIRQGSVGPTGRRSGPTGYFVGRHHRRHHRGGFSFGK